jgi:very-short-patch-repair endonuclease
MPSVSYKHSSVDKVYKSWIAAKDFRKLDPHLLEINKAKILEVIVAYQQDRLKTKFQNKLRQYISNFIIYGISDDWVQRIERIIACGSAMTKESNLLRYGDVEGLKRWEKYCNFQSTKNTFDYKNKVYGMTEDEFKKYNASRAVTHENLINRHGKEEGQRIWDEYVAKQRVNGKTLEYFQEKLGKEEGENFYRQLNEQKKHDLASFVRKYGAIVGEKKFVKYITKSRVFPASPISQELCWSIYEDLPQNYKSFCRFDDLNSEFLLYNNTRSCFFDFALENKKVLIEFQGDLFHANPEQYKPNDIVNVAFKGEKKASEIWERDREKKDIAEAQGYTLIYVWESDYSADKAKTVRKCLDVIYAADQKVL